MDVPRRTCMRTRRKSPRSARRLVRVAAYLAVIALATGLSVATAPASSAQLINTQQCEIAPGVYGTCPKVEDDRAITGIHPHTKWHRYRISTSTPSSWRDAVNEGAKAWTDRTTFGLSYYGLIDSTDPQTGYKIVWRGSIPLEWRAPNCPPSKTYACARWLYSSGHTTDVDFVYNKDHAIGTNTFNCAFDYPDVQALAVHEFGHWGVLDHTSNPYNAMSGSQDGGGGYKCIRVPTAYDQELMEYNFVKGGHTL